LTSTAASKSPYGTDGQAALQLFSDTPKVSKAAATSSTSSATSKIVDGHSAPQLTLDTPKATDSDDHLLDDISERLQDVELKLSEHFRDYDANMMRLGALGLRNEELTDDSGKLWADPDDDSDQDVDSNLDFLRLRVDALEAQQESTAKNIISFTASPPGSDPRNHSSIDSLIAEYKKPSLDDELDKRFRELAHETLASLHEFIETHITRRTEVLFEKISDALKLNVQR